MKNRIYISWEVENFDKKSMLPVIRKAVNTTLRHEKFEYPCEVSVSVVSLEKIHHINAEYRKKDSPTDVLSFPMLSEGKLGADDWDCDFVILGDIIICADKIKEQSEEFSHSFERELAYLTVHSTLHLLGYDHETSREDELEMTEKQNKIIKSMGL